MTKAGGEASSPSLSSDAFKGASSSYISYGDSAAHLNQLAIIIRNFSKTMSQALASQVEGLYPSLPDIFPDVDWSSAEDDKLDRDMALEELYKAQVVCETTKAAFQLLTESPTLCRGPHLTYVHLSGFRESEVAMIISVCGGSEDDQPPEKWHPTYWKGKSRFHKASPSQGSTTSFCCSILKKAWRLKTPVRLSLNNQGDWDSGLLQTVPQDRITPPDRPLQELLRMGRENGHTRLSKKDRLDLASSIARSLLHLVGGPLLQSQWSSDNIVVDRLAQGDRRHEPYVVQALRNSPETGTFSRGSSAVVGLGVLLWELLFDLKVTIEPQDEDDEDDDGQLFTLHNALTRQVLHSQETFLDQPSLNIIRNCLTLFQIAQAADDEALNMGGDGERSTGPHNRDKDDRFRRELYWRVIRPLSHCARLYDSSRGHIVPRAPKRKADPDARSWSQAGKKNKSNTELAILEEDESDEDLKIAISIPSSSQLGSSTVV